jgi:hypothetical protein
MSEPQQHLGLVASLAKRDLVLGHTLFGASHPEQPVTRR